MAQIVSTLIFFGDHPYQRFRFLYLWYKIKHPPLLPRRGWGYWSGQKAHRAIDFLTLLIFELFIYLFFIIISIP